MKKLITAAMALAMVLGMTACGDRGSSSESDSKAESSAAEEAASSGETVELAGWSVFVPSGWVSQSFMDDTQVKLYKTDDINKAFGVPEIDITYKANGTYALVDAMFESHEDVAPITAGSYTWEGVKGAYDSSKDLMSLNTKVGDGYLAADLWIKVNDATISADDADVKAILEGITVK